jgi:hypothetical protein
MILHFTKTAAISALILATTPAMALIHGELSVGQRSGNFEQSGSSGKTLSGQTVEIAGYLDPIPLVPIGVGVRLVSDAFDAKIADHGFKSMTSTAIVPEVTAWLPFSLIMDLVPFARVGYTAVSAYKATTEASVAGVTASGSVVLKSTGPRIAAGLNYEGLPFMAVSLAFEQSSETLSISEGKIGGVDLSAGAKDITFNNTAILVGVKAGI